MKVVNTVGRICVVDESIKCGQPGHVIADFYTKDAEKHAEAFIKSVQERDISDYTKP